MLAPSAARCVVQKRKPLANALQLLANSFQHLGSITLRESQPSMTSVCLVLGKNENSKIMNEKLFRELPAVPPTPTNESFS